MRFPNILKILHIRQKIRALLNIKYSGTILVMINFEGLYNKLKGVKGDIKIYYIRPIPL